LWTLVMWAYANGVRAHHETTVVCPQGSEYEGESLLSRIDLTDYGQTYEALTAIDSRPAGVDAVVHTAAPFNGEHGAAPANVGSGWRR
jgi:hypothetical protein